jgi:hypothetical protein
MKKPTSLLLIVTLCTVLFSCLKEGVNTAKPSSSLIGTTWNVVTDSTTTGFWGIWSGRATTGSKYIGKAGDYFNFTNYGKLYSSINGQKDTEYYRITGDTLGFRYAYIDGQTNQPDSTYNQAYIISNLTNHTVTLSSSFVSPETVFTSIVNLSK